MCLPKIVSGSTIQAIATIVGNLLCFNFGLIFGITPPHLKLYQSEATPLSRTVDDEDSIHIASFLFLSAASGAFFAGILVKKIGPKSVLLLSGLIQITAWFCIHFGYKALHIESSRLFAGIAAGAAFTALPIFIQEIAEDDNQNSLIASIDRWRSLGVIIGFALGFYLRHDYVNIVGICTSFVFTMVFPFIQESPYYYQRKNNVSSMEKSLRWFRGIRNIDDRDKPEFLKELALFKNDNNNTNNIMNERLPISYIIKIIIFGIILSVAGQFSGIFVIFNYGREIFELIGGSTPFNLSECIIILASMQLIGALISGWIREIINRKMLYFITSLICALSFILLSVYLNSNTQLNSLYAQWLPLGLLSLHLISANLGLYPLSSLIVLELLPTKLRDHIFGIMQAFSWLTAFLLIQFFKPLEEFWGLIGCFLLYASILIVVGLFVFFFIPETRHRSSEEIQKSLGFNDTGNIAKISTVTNGHITSDYI